MYCRKAFQKYSHALKFSYRLGLFVVDQHNVLHRKVDRNI